jgi:4-carboxymuconolactone decarboxylase
MPRKFSSSRLPEIPDSRLSPAQRAMRDEMMASRGLKVLDGPFAVWLHAPIFGNLVQQLGAHCRYRTQVPPRLSEFAILVVARHWRAQYEWHAHASIAAKAGVKPSTIRDLRAGRRPKAAPADERAIYDFIVELQRTRRVADRTYARVRDWLGDAGLVEFVGIVGYYTLVAMTLDVFRVPLPAGEKLPFREPAAKARAKR